MITAMPDHDDIDRLIKELEEEADDDPEQEEPVLPQGWGPPCRTGDCD